jgi:hypothetical protein
MARPIAFSPRFAASGETIAGNAMERAQRSVACTDERALSTSRLTRLRDQVRRGAYDTPQARAALARRLLERGLL